MAAEIGILGFGNQGEPWALNLRDSGWEVRTFFRAEGGNAGRARSLGFPVEPVENIGSVPVLAVLIPDDAMPSFGRAHAGRLREGQALVFAHGFTLHYRTAPWPETLDRILVAPKGIGSAVRERFLGGSGVPAVLAVDHDRSGNARGIARRVAEGIGAARAGLYEGTVREEVEADLFSEQALLCGGLPALLAETYDILVHNGVTPEVAYLECVHELQFMADLFARNGIHETLRAASSTARFGGFRASPRLASVDLRKRLEVIFSEIRDGSFRNALTEEAAAGFPATHAAMETLRASPLETTGARVRRGIEGRRP